MPKCPECRGDMSRRHRTPFQRLLYSAVFLCRPCDFRLATYNPFIFRQVAWGRFLLSRQSRCIKCGSYDVHPARKLDKIDSLSLNLLSSIPSLFGAPLKKCPDCRLQYHDWRSVKAKTMPAAAVQAKDASSTR